MSTRLRPTPDRTAVRKFGIVVLVVALVAGAGCSGAVLGGNSGGGSGLVDYVPANQNVVVEVDMAITQDDTTQQLLQAGEDDGESNEQDLEESLSEFEAETGLDPRGLNSVLIYGQSGMTTSVGDVASQESGGIVLDTEWTIEELTQAFESTEASASLEERSYTESGAFYEIVPDDGTNDQRIFLGAHGDGVFVVGTEEPVRNSLDVTYAGGDALGGALADAYDSTRDGYVTFAMTTPESSGTSGSGGLGASLSESVQALTAVYYTDGDTIGLEGRIATDSSDTAGLLNMTVQSQLAQFQQDPEFSEVSSNLKIETDGTDLVVTYESDVQTLIDAAESGN